MQKTARVALDIETSRIYGRQILAGIARYLRAHQHWSIYVEQSELGSTPHAILDHWRGDGLITRQTTADVAARLRRMRLSVVDLSDIGDDFGLPRITSDHRRIGEMGAEHLLERGFKNFGCCGFRGQRWSESRKEAFQATVIEAGSHADEFESDWYTDNKVWSNELKSLRKWLKSLPKPVGIFATNDVNGQHLLNACGHEGIAVPEEVAVVGVDDDELLCELCNPPLTSIIPNAERIGFEAAELLDALMTGQTPKETTIEVPPLGISTRQSSDTLAVPDSYVAAALKFIRENACHGTSVDAVLQNVAVSRSWLERNFRKHLGHSPQAEIRKVQIKRVKELLTGSDMALDQIAGLCGYEHPEYMSVVFKRETGHTPGQFRKMMH